MTKKTMVLLSGGFDSSVMLMKIKQTSEVAAIFMDRGQSNRESEQAAARKVAAHAGCQLDEVDIRSWWTPVKNKVEMIDVPRNAIFALLASPFAMIQHCDEIAIGSTASDARTGDSNAGFVAAFNGLVGVMALARMPRLIAPLLDLGWNKTEVAKWARTNVGEAFIAMTHSCWKKEPCGTCPACLARAAALRDSG